MAADPSLSAIFKAYDVRGLVPEELDEARAWAVGHGFAEFASRHGADRVLVARDCRTSGEALARAFAAGALAAGRGVVDLGLASTDLLYFASGYLDAPGAMLTASHNPPAYNGIKLCLAGARPIGRETGLEEVQALSERVLSSVPPVPGVPPGDVAGRLERRDLLPEFAAHVRSFVDPGAMRPLRVVADAANGMGGLVAPKVFEGLAVELELLYGELDGTFPHHPADPLQAENLSDLVARVRATRADVGLAFDGDADRVFLVDDEGVPLSGSTTTAIVAVAMLDKHPGATILHNLICSKAVPELVREHGGVPVRTRVGHSYIKAVMAETDAVFGGEHSGHYYFRDNYRADSGIIAALVVLEVLSRAATPLSQLRRRYERYAGSGELNTAVADTALVIAEVAEHYDRLGASLDFLDGLTVDLGSWWFNLRPSNTEPLLRLNVEAPDATSCAARVAEVLELVRRADEGARRRAAADARRGAP
jgi:phosphomannomutase